jgi:hypothetical protein
MMVCGMMMGRRKVSDLREDVLRPCDWLFEECFRVNRTNNFVESYAHFKLVGISMRRFTAQEH